MIAFLSRFGIWVIFLLLLAGNTYVFAKGVELGERIHSYELEISQLKKDNLQLEAQIYQAESISYAASLAAYLDFDKKSEPVFFAERKYALK